jgi:DNA ligase-associated putative exonuclease
MGNPGISGVFFFELFCMNLLSFTDMGIYCAAGDFYIDPWKPVSRAVISHAHSDHARPGNQHYLCHHLTKPLLILRLGNISIQSVEWNDPVIMNGVTVSLHPAGHIIGSSQIRVEYKGEVWVVSGDYKTENDGISGEMEIVPCEVFVTESTFGLPIYKWRPQQILFYEVQNWILANREKGRNSVLIAYSLGKAQRLLKGIEEISASIFVHGAIWNTQEALQQAGFKLPPVKRIEPGMNRESFRYYFSAAISREFSLDEPVSSVFHRCMQRLDAGTGKRTPTKCGCRICTERSCRLERAYQCSPILLRKKCFCHPWISVILQSISE